MFGPPPGFATHPSMLTNGMLNRSGSDATGGGNNDNRPVSPSRDMSPEMRKARVQNSMRILKDEPVPEGYLRFRLVYIENFPRL